MAAAKYLKLTSGIVREGQGTDEITYSATGAINFATATDTAGELDQLVLPKIAGTPTATPTSGEASIVWNSSAKLLMVWDGSAWVNNYASASSASNVDNTYTAGAGGISARDCVYISAADTILPADADAESTAKVIGIAPSAITAAASGSVRSAGLVTGFSGLTAGARYWLSQTAGAITTTPPSGAGVVLYQIGYAKSTTVLHLQLMYIATLT